MRKRKGNKLIWLIILVVCLLGYGSYKGLTYLNGKTGSISVSAGLKWDKNTPYITAIVTDVVDGDTFHAVISNKKETVRLLLVDTPETKHPTKPIEPFGPEASAFTKEMLEGKQVKLVSDISDRDRYGRLLRYVWVDGQMLNELLLERGLARVAVFPPDVKFVDSFRAVQKKAREAERGIWSLENYVNDSGIHAEDSNEPKPQHSLETEEIYQSCSAVRAAGKAPIHKGDKGYSRLLDRDGDGIGCE